MNTALRYSFNSAMIIYAANAAKSGIRAKLSLNNQTEKSKEKRVAVMLRSDLKNGE